MTKYIQQSVSEDHKQSQKSNQKSAFGGHTQWDSGLLLAQVKVEEGHLLQCLGNQEVSGQNLGLQHVQLPSKCLPEPK